MEREFDLQLFAATLPDNPASTSQGVSGDDFLIYINTGTVAVPVWTLIGGQRDTTLNRSKEIIDVSSKTSGGYKCIRPGQKSWGVDLSALVLLQDAGIDALAQAYDEDKDVNIKFEWPDSSYVTGWAVVSEYPVEAPYNGEATLKGTLEGNGPLSTRVITAITPLVATMSKAAAADKTFTITPSSTLLNSVKVNDVALTVTTHYTYSAGTLVIKGTYLTTLAIATHDVVIDVQGGNDLTVAVTITA